LVTKIAGIFIERKVSTQARFVARLWLFGLAVLGSGCSIAGNPISSVASADKIITDSIATKAKTDGLSEGDVEILKRTVATIAVKDKISPVTWSNPETGTSGSIVAIDNFLGKHGQKCRGFKTSVTNFTGVGLYNGEACQLSPDNWVLSWFKSIDGET